MMMCNCPVEVLHSNVGLFTCPLRDIEAVSILGYLCDHEVAFVFVSLLSNN